MELLSSATGIPWHGMACRGMPWHGMPCHGMPWHAMPWHCMPCHGMPWHAMPWHAHAMPKGMPCQQDVTQLPQDVTQLPQDVTQATGRYPGTMDQGTKGTKGTPQAPRPGARAPRAALQLAFHCRPGGPGPGPGGLRCTLGTLGTLVPG